MFRMWCFKPDSLDEVFHSVSMFLMNTWWLIVWIIYSTNRLSCDNFIQSEQRHDIYDVRISSCCRYNWHNCQYLLSRSGEFTPLVQSSYSSVGVRDTSCCNSKNNATLEQCYAFKFWSNPNPQWVKMDNQKRFSSSTQTGRELALITFTRLEDAETSTF